MENKNTTIKTNDLETIETIEPRREKRSSKAISVLKAIASGLVWGLGQLLNKQFLKALFFFMFFVAFIGIELGTSNYFKENDPYDRIAGNNFISQTTGANFISIFQNDYYLQERDKYNLDNMPQSFKDFDEEFYVAGEGYKLKTEDQLIDFIAKDLKKNNPTSYRNILTNQIIDVTNGDDMIDSRVNIQIREVLYRDLEQDFYLERVYKDADGKDVKDYVEVNFLTGELNLDNILTSAAGLSTYKKLGNVYIIGEDLYVETEVEFVDDPVYMNMRNPEEVPLFILPDDAIKVEHQGPLYLNNEVVYEYIKPGLIYNRTRRQYVGTPFTEVFTKFMSDSYNAFYNNYTSEDYTRLMIKINLSMHPEEKLAFEKDFNNFFYDKAGLFVKSFWGVFTLGTTKKITFTEYVALSDALTRSNGNRFVTIDESYPILGHVSTHVLLEGLIGVILTLFFLIFMIWSIVDAYRISERKRKQQEIQKGAEYFKDVYESSFEYIVLSPALFVLAFISIMPIVFGFLLAFTSISGDQSMNDTFDYVGFKNFFSLFSFGEGLGSSFGKAFWRVLLWTIIWAVFSTGTVFFGGLFQALILNSERVKFKKFWRTILILPWAMPALLSQMVFSVMFGETGFINNLFRSLGLYDLFMSLGMLGRDFSVLRGIEKIFYIGRDNIQWFTNPFNPTFVRIVLIVVNIWLGFPYFMALMTGIMTSIDKSLYEAADIDGATKGQKLRFITMPLILYSTAPILIMTFSGNFNNFGVIYFITGGGPNAGLYSRGFAGDTDILIFWMYKLTVDESIYNIASVFSVLIFIFVGSITAWNLSRTRAFRED